MNRKLINGLLLLATATAGVGMFTSCKDTDEDYAKEIMVGQKNLTDRLNNLQTDLDALKNWRPVIEEAISKLRSELQAEIDANKNAIDQVNGKIEVLTQQIAKLEGDLAAINDKIATLETAINSINDRLDALGGRVDDLNNKVDSEVARINEEINKLSEAIDNLAASLQGQIDTLKQDLEGVTTKVDGLYDDIHGEGGIIDQITAISDRLDVFSDRLDAVEEEAAKALGLAETNAAAIEKLVALTESLDGRVGTLEDNVRDLQEALVDVMEELENLENEVALNTADIENIYEILNRHDMLFSQLQTQMGNIFNALNNNLKEQVTSVIAEGTANPVFGYLNTPFGIKSNMLLGYAGVADITTTFPAAGTKAEFNTNASTTYLTDAELTYLESIGIKPEQITSGDILMQKGPGSHDGEGYLGTLYMTINPLERDFSTINVSLVTSDGQSSPAGDLVIKSSSDRLKYGYTRAEESTVTEQGFYATEVSVPKTSETTNTLGIQINKEIGTAFKNLVENRSMSDLAYVAKTIYDQFNGVCDAYAINVNYKQTNVDLNGNNVETDRNVRSGYNIGVATFKPLSYCFLYGQGSDLRLPEFSPLSEVLENLKKDIKLEITFNDVTWTPIKLDKATYEIKDAQIIIDLGGLEVVDLDGNPLGELPLGTTVTLGYSDSKIIGNETALNSLINELNAKLGGLVDNLQGQVNTQVQAMINNINAQLQGINGQIQGSLDKIFENIKNQLGNKLDLADNLIEKYNQIARKINNILANPNAYLQVMMAYRGADGQLHHLSTNPNDPTRLVGNGEGVELFATSYSAELIAPSYMKVVAVIAENGRITRNGTLNKINTDSELNQILPGRQQRIALNTEAMEEGNVYTILYTSMDYAGHTSTRRYYVTK